MQRVHMDETGKIVSIEIIADGWVECEDCWGEGTFTDMYGDETTCPYCQGEGMIFIGDE